MATGKLKYTIITGASGGLGREMAVNCARKGMNLLLLALPGSNISYFSKMLCIEFNIEAHVFELDLTDKSALQKTVNYITSNYEVNFLINNAGIGGTSRMVDTSLEKLDAIIQLNIRSVVFLTRLMIPHLVKQGKAHILNVSSMAAFTPIAYKAVYPASKAFISSFSMGLREELHSHGISVSVFYPGPIMTNSEITSRILRQGLKGRIGLLPTNVLASIAIDGALKGRMTIIPGIFNKINHLLMNLLPTAIKLKVVSGQVKKELQYDWA